MLAEARIDSVDAVKSVIQMQPKCPPEVEHGIECTSKDDDNICVNSTDFARHFSYPDRVHLIHGLVSGSSWLQFVIALNTYQSDSLKESTRGKKR